MPMMLTIQHPGIREAIRDLPPGLWVARPDPDEPPLLIVKATKEIILTAIERGGFAFYPVSMQVGDTVGMGLLTAFFDDADEPLCIRTLLFDDPLSDSLVELITSGRLTAHFFDEQEVELAGFTARVDDPAGQAEKIRSFRRSKPDPKAFLTMLATTADWFGLRDAEADRVALRVVFTEPLFPPDIAIIDLDRTADYLGAPNVPFHSLVQKDNPGSFQEPGIAEALQRVFGPANVHLNPFRGDYDEELADALVIGPSRILVVQAKDSPNNKDALDRTLNRKRATGRKQMEKARSQLIGALGQIMGRPQFAVRTGGVLYEVPLNDRTVMGVMIIKELFADEAGIQREEVEKVERKSGAPAIVLDYPGLALLAHHLPTPELFLEGLDDLRIWLDGGRHPDVPQYILERFDAGRPIRRDMNGSISTRGADRTDPRWQK